LLFVVVASSLVQLSFSLLCYVDRSYEFSLQEFFLQGRFIFGPDVRSLFLTIFLILAPAVVFCIFVARHLINDFPDHWGIAVMVVVIVFTIYVSTVFVTYKLFLRPFWPACLVG
jgi:hypothetical protein